LPRIAVLALAVSLPGLVVLAALVGMGLLAVRPGLIAGAVVLVSIALIIGRTVSDLALVRHAIDNLGPDSDMGTIPRQIARRLAPMARELWLAIARLDRVWRQRFSKAESQVAAAEDVIR
jgi:hypothetical protein